jgi:serine/threonine protein kinase
LRELKIVQIYAEGISLAEVISMNPVWWTATAKAKAVAGIVLGIRFAHSLGLIHGHLNSRNIFFDSDHRIQITDFCVIDEEVEPSEKDANVGVSSFVSAKWSPKIDLDGFMSVLVEIIVGHPITHSDVSHGRKLLSPDLPTFVSQLISADKSSDQGIRESFNDIFNILKMNDFQILSDVDSVEVLRFVDWVECFE